MMQWLESLPYHAWFWGSAAPVPAPTAEPILSRLSQDPRSLILRAGRGLYFKAHPDDVSKDWGCDLTVSALLCAGDGAGLHRSGALNALGWSTQRPVKINVATLRPLEPYSPYVPLPPATQRMACSSDVERDNHVGSAVIAAVRGVGLGRVPEFHARGRQRQQAALARHDPLRIPSARNAAGCRT